MKSNDSRRGTPAVVTALVAAAGLVMGVGVGCKSDAPKEREIITKVHKTPEKYKSTKRVNKPLPPGAEERRAAEEKKRLEKQVREGFSVPFVHPAGELLEPREPNPRKLQEPRWDAPVALDFERLGQLFKGYRLGSRMGGDFSPEVLAELHGAAVTIDGVFALLDEPDDKARVTRFWLVNPRGRAVDSHNHGDHGHGGHGGHDGHDHGGAAKAHGEEAHAGHDHGAHKGHDHAAHEGHDHEGHDHAGCDHADHAGHDHAAHEGHDHGKPEPTVSPGHGHDHGKKERGVGMKRGDIVFVLTADGAPVTLDPAALGRTNGRVRAAGQFLLGPGEARDGTPYLFALELHELTPMPEPK